MQMNLQIQLSRQIMRKNFSRIVNDQLKMLKTSTSIRFVSIKFREIYEITEKLHNWTRSRVKDCCIH